MRVAAGVVLAAVAASQHGLPHLRAVSGTPQSALAYASGTSAQYVTVFPTPLRVAVGAAKNVAVRFSSVTAGCTLPPQDQPDTVVRVDPASYDVKVVKGNAEISLTLATGAPGTFTVLAYPSTARHRAGAVAFTLVAR